MAVPAEISRVIRSKKQAIKAYDRLSRWYDWLSENSEWPMTLIGLQKLNASPGEALLEIGFGTGNALLVLAEAVGDSGKVVGIDISPGMHEVARRKILHAGLSRGVHLQQGDAAALPYPNDYFDAIFSSFSLELFDTLEIPVVLTECRRVLKPGGRFGVITLVREDRETTSQRIYEWFHRFLPAYVDCRPIFLQRTLKMAGFQIQDITLKWMWGLPVEICLAQKTAAKDLS